MTSRTQISHTMLAGCAGLLLVIGAGCGKSSTADGAGGGIGTGGFSGDGGATAGSGGGSGGNGTMSLSGTGGGSGGSSTATSAGSGGGTGSGGASAAKDAAVPDSSGRDTRNGAEANSGRDTAADAPGPQPDTGGSTGGDGGCVPDYACKPTSPNTGDNYADCVARVNQFRACVCLPPLARWTAGEACADQDSQYDSVQATAHAGAQANICDWGNAQDECPGWATPRQVIDGCFLQMFQEGPPPAGSCTGTCYSQHGHYINMTGTSYKNGIACGFFTTSSGSVWAAQNFK